MSGLDIIVAGCIVMFVATVAAFATDLRSGGKK